MFFYCDGQLTRNVLTLYPSLKGSFLRYFGRILGCVPVFFENSPVAFFIDILDYTLMATRLQKLVRFCRMGPFYIYFLIFLELFNIFNDILHRYSCITLATTILLGSFYDFLTVVNNSTFSQSLSRTS